MKMYTNVLFSLNGFNDPESGITDRLVGVGTTESGDDVIALTSVDSDTFVLDSRDCLKDGVLYYALAKVHNHKFIKSINVACTIFSRKD